MLTQDLTLKRNPTFVRSSCLQTVDNSFLDLGLDALHLD